MEHHISERFTFSRPPSGRDIAELVKEHSLYDYTMDVERKSVEASFNGLNSLSPYVWQAVFTRKKDNS